MRSQGNKEVKMEIQHKAMLSRWAPLLWGLMLDSFVAVDGSGELLSIGSIEVLSAKLVEISWGLSAAAVT